MNALWKRKGARSISTLLRYRYLVRQIGICRYLSHLELRYEMSHTITSHHVHHFHQTRIRDGTLLDYMVQYRKPLSPQFFLYLKKISNGKQSPHKEFHLCLYIQNNANQ